MLAAQVAPIGANTCTNRATRKTGRNFLTRRRISETTFFQDCQLIMQGVGCRDKVPADMALPA
jgi:hypothetical protein